MANAEKKRSKVTVKMADWEKRFLERAADEAGTTMSALMRDGGRDRARRILDGAHHKQRGEKTR